MNANELADAMDTHGFRYHHVKKAVVMLRQQQAEIESLLKFINERGETGQLIIWKAQEK